MKRQSVKVTELRLDNLNPRLPEHLQGSDDSSAILQYLFENDVLEELAESFVDNGFFDQEPLIVLREGDDSLTVVEGNRRLAALQILLEEGPAQDADLTFTLDPPPNKQQLYALRKVPCYVVESRDEVRRFLGFRHIGGLKMWNPEAKARYLLDEIERTQASLEGTNKNVFTLVGREVGSNAQGVRNPYIAIKILLFAREEFSIDISYVQRWRFGVWVRGMNSNELREYIGFNGARSYDEVQEALGGLDGKKLNEVIGDLTPKKGFKKAVLGDSRDVTAYARVLADDHARDALRRYNDLGVAKQIIDQTTLPLRLQRIADSLTVLLAEIERQGKATDLSAPSESIFSLARSLRALVRGLSEEE